MSRDEAYAIRRSRRVDSILIKIARTEPYSLRFYQPFIVNKLYSPAKLSNANLEKLSRLD
jgi:hypothetical protein